MARLFSRHYKGSTQASAATTGSDAAVFDAAGVASVTSADEFLLHNGIELAGEPGVFWDILTAGDATLNATVPTGKYWRVLSAVMRITADATAANRLGVAITRTAADAAIKTLTQTSAVTANQDLIRQFSWGTDDNLRGNNSVASAGTLTIAEPVTDTDTFTINSQVFTVVATMTGAANEILIGADETATKANLDEAFVTRTSATAALTNVHSVTDAVHTATGCSFTAFAADDLVLTALVKGLAGDSIDTTETWTHVSNVFDAATLGTTTAGVDVTDIVSDIDWPTAGCWLTPGEDVLFSVTNGVAGDNFEVVLSYVEYDESIV